jgi:hypothetical protein
VQPAARPDGRERTSGDAGAVQAAQKYSLTANSVKADGVIEPEIAVVSD